MNSDVPTDDEIDAHDSAAMDSVALLSGPRPAYMRDADWADARSRNIEHLALMITKPWWKPRHNMAPLIAARDGI